MGLHTCAPPRGGRLKAQSFWTCSECGAVWEAAPDGRGVFDFDRNEIVTRAEWLLVDGPALLAG